MPQLRQIPALALLLLAIPGLRPPPQAGDGLVVSNIGISYVFGQQITFTAQLTAGLPITQAEISFRDIDEPSTRVEALTLSADGSTGYRYDAALNVIPPFATIVFSYQATLVGGETVTSPPFYFRYEDNRFNWKSAADGPVTVHWYEGDDAFGQAALEAARASLQGTSQVVPISLDAPLDVYIYSGSEALQSALILGGSEWLAGHADPGLGVAVVSVAPGEQQTVQLQRQVPHELARVMLYRSLGRDGYDRLPVWLNEGIASMAESYPDPAYPGILALASQNDSLLRFVDLCAAFPADSAGASVAYAESDSFVRYLRDTYGNTGLIALTRAYADGLDCELGATRAVGTPLSQLDARWRESALGQNVVGAAVRNLLPYLVMLGFVLIVPLWSAIVSAYGRRRRAGRE
jgi:peptidase MA superfamily protein